MMKELELRRVLTDLAEQGVPAEPDLWLAIRARMAGDAAGPEQRRTILARLALARLVAPWSRLPSRITMLLLGLMGVLFAGTAYAALPLIQQQLGSSPEGRQMLAYGQTMHLTRTVNGFSVTLDWAYADRTGGLLGYTITALDGETFNNLSGRARVIMPDGTQIPITGGSGTGMLSSVAGNFVSFGPVPVTVGDTKLSLRLSVDAIEAIQSDGNSRMVRGPWVFDFTVPIAPARLIEPRQTVVADGWPITLESIVMTPPGTWVTLRGAGPDADVELIAAGKTYHLYQDGFVAGPEVKTCFAAHQSCPELWKDRDTTYEAIAMEPECSLLCRLEGQKPGLQEDKDKTSEWMRELQQAHGEWTIVVKPDPTFANPIFQLRGGPWVFHVQMP